MPDNSVRIEQIRKILALGVSSATRDGETITYDLDSLRRELRDLEATDDTRRGRRPRMFGVNLG